MENTIGQLIGIVKHVHGITNDAGDKVQITESIDFSTASDIEVKCWLVADRIIARTRVERKLTKSEIMELDGSVVLAQCAGQKIQSPAEVKKMAMAAFDNMDRDQQATYLQEMADRIKGTE